MPSGLILVIFAIDFLPLFDWFHASPRHKVLPAGAVAPTSFKLT
jgi:hypothetical protein